MGLWDRITIDEQDRDLQALEDELSITQEHLCKQTQKIRNLEAQLEDLRLLNLNLTKELNLKQKSFFTQTTKTNDLKANITSLEQRLEIASKIENKFNYIIHIHDKYHTSIKPIIQDEIKFTSMENDPINTYVHLIHKKNIDRLWECVRERLLVNRVDPQGLQLQEFLYALMERFFLINPQYAYMEEENKTPFNSLNHEVHKNSKETMGVLSSIILKGYLNQKTNNIMKKSIVTLQ